MGPADVHGAGRRAVVVVKVHHESRTGDGVRRAPSASDSMDARRCVDGLITAARRVVCPVVSGPTTGGGGGTRKDRARSEFAFLDQRRDDTNKMESAMIFFFLILSSKARRLTASQQSLCTPLSRRDFPSAHALGSDISHFPLGNLPFAALIKDFSYRVR